MELNQQNPNLGQPLPNPEQNTIEIYTNGITFRVDSHRYLRKKTFLSLATILWWQAIVASIFLMLIDVANNNNFNSKNVYLPLFVQMCIFFSFLTLVSFLNYRYLNPAFTTSMLLTAIYLIALTVLYGLQVGCLWLASIIYVSLLMIISFLCYKSVKNIILLGLLGLQLNLIVFRVDGKFDEGWPAVLVILILFCIATGVMGIVLIIFGFIQRLSEPRYTLQAIGISYMGLVHFGFCLDASIILAKLLFSITIYPIAIACALYHLLLIIFVASRKDQICLFKANGVIVSVSGRQVIASFKKIVEQKKLYRLSDNWFSFKDRQTSKSKIMPETQLVIETYPTIHSATQCAVCLSQQATLVWMPCGHMTICQTCGNYLMKNGRIKCVLCKQKAEEIYHMPQQEFKFQKNEYVSDFCYKMQVNY